MSVVPTSGQHGCSKSSGGSLPAFFREGTPADAPVGMTKVMVFEVSGEIVSGPIDGPDGTAMTTRVKLTMVTYYRTVATVPGKHSKQVLISMTASTVAKDAR